MAQSPKRKNASKEILKYIQKQQLEENPMDTKADVMRYCVKKSVCSEPIAHAVIIELVNKRKLIVKKDKPNSQVHHLAVNYKNDYILIDKELSELENTIDMMSEPMHKMGQQRAHELYMGRPAFAELREHFEFPYRNAFGTIFLYILNYINSKIHSDEDLQILYRRVFELMIKLHQQTFVIEETQRSLSPLIHQLEKLQNLSAVEAYAKNNMIDIKPADNIVTTIKNFVIRFMSH